MINFTDKAIEWVRVMRESMGRQHSGLRIALIGGTKCTDYEFFVGFEDEPLADDQRFELADFEVYIDPATYKLVEGAQVDFVDTPQGSGFVVSVTEENKSQSGSCHKEGLSCKSCNMACGKKPD